MLLLAALLACAPTPPAPPVTPPVAEAPEIELAVIMLRNQTHASKLWFAGQAGNWPLAGFYVRELGESYNEVAEGHIVEDGKDISAMMRTMFEPALKSVRSAVVAGEKIGFEAAYDTMIGQCNACHQAAGHGYVVLQRPAGPEFTNQRFEPVPNAPLAPALPHDENSPFDND